MWGRHAEAREQLTAAVEVLRAEPDTDTVRALDQLAALEVFAGSPDADRLTTEALTLGQALDVGTGQLGWPVPDPRDLPQHSWPAPRGGRLPPRSARLAARPATASRLGRALLNLADVLSGHRPAAAAEAARTAAGHLRRVGDRDHLAFAIGNLAEALLMLGDWDAAEAELTQAVDSDGLADIEFLACYRGWLAALRGDAATAETMLAGLPDLRASEDPQDKARSASWRPSPPPPAASRRTRCATPAAPSLTPTPSGSATRPCAGRGRWPPAPPTTCGTPPPPASCSPCSTPTSPGTWPPCCGPNATWPAPASPPRDGDPAAAAVFAAAISGLRELSTPYHLAHGLLDHAEYLTRLGDAEAAAAAIGEARDIASRLRCQPLLDRAADLTPTGSAVPADRA